MEFDKLYSIVHVTPFSSWLVHFKSYSVSYTHCSKMVCSVGWVGTYSQCRHWWPPWAMNHETSIQPRLLLGPIFDAHHVSSLINPFKTYIILCLLHLIYAIQIHKRNAPNEVIWHSIFSCLQGFISMRQWVQSQLVIYSIRT